MEPPAPSRLLQLPGPVLADIAARSGCEPSVRSTCKQLRGIVLPTAIAISYQRLKYVDHHTISYQQLRMLHSLSAAWQDVTCVNVTGQDFDSAAIEDISIPDHAQLLLVFFSNTAAALVPWCQLQSAAVPISSALVATLLRCQLSRLGLSDSTFRRCNQDDDEEPDNLVEEGFDEEQILRPQLAVCLDVLSGYNCLRSLSMELSVVRLEARHVQALSRLTQLHELDLSVINTGWMRSDVTTQDVVAAINHLKQLTTLRLKAKEMCADQQIGFGTLPCLRSLLLCLDNASSGLNATPGPSMLSGFPCLENVSINAACLVANDSFWVLHVLVHVNVSKQDFDDEMVSALAPCPCLQYLQAHVVALTKACTHRLLALRELQISSVQRCDIALAVVAPNLQVLLPKRCNGLAPEVTMLSNHPNLAAFSVRWSLLLEGRHPQFCMALATLTALTSLDVMTDDTLNGTARIACSLSQRVVGVRDLRVSFSPSAFSSQHLHALLHGMGSVQTLRLSLWHEHPSSRAHPSQYSADALIWGVSVCVRDMHQLRAIEVDALWLVVCKKQVYHVGGLPCLTAFLLGLAAAPRLTLVQVVGVDKVYDSVKDFDPAQDFELRPKRARKTYVYNLIQQHVELARAMRALQFVVEVV